MKFVLRRDPSYIPGESLSGYGLWDLCWGQREPADSDFVYEHRSYGGQAAFWQAVQHIVRRERLPFRGGLLE